MSVTIINQCKKTYKPDPENILSHILERIPGKFVVGLDEIRVFDSRPRKTLRKSTVCKRISSHHSIIEIYMDDPALSGYPFSSILLFNMVFMFALDEHIKTCLKPHSNDEEVLSCTPKSNYGWFYVGIWSPLLTILRIGRYLTSRIRMLRKGVFYLTNRFIEKHK